MLHPIGVDRSYGLIFGARRLEAHKALGLDTIKVRILDIADPLLAEEHENTTRKDFTPSERVAIAAALKEAIGTRQGQRTDRVQGELPENIPEVTGQETRQVIARRSGFGNETTLRQATIVVEQGIPALVAAMDNGVIAIATAAKLARAPAATQHQAVDQPQEAPALAKQAGALRKPAIIDNDSGAVFDTQRAARAAVPAPLAPGSVAVYLKSHTKQAAHIARVARDLPSMVGPYSRTPLASALEDLRDIRDSAARLIASLEKLAKQGGAL